MNKFHVDKKVFVESFRFSIAIAVVILFVSWVTNTPHYTISITAAVISFLSYFYLSFVEREEGVLNKWLAKSAFVFYQMSFLSTLAYLDNYYFGIE